MSDFKKMMMALDGWLDGVSDEYVTAFDQWLNEARAEAWEEGHNAGQHNEHEYRQGRAISNPYREKEQNS